MLGKGLVTNYVLCACIDCDHVEFLSYHGIIIHFNVDTKFLHVCLNDFLPN